MSTPSDVVHDFTVQSGTTERPTRPLWWSVRREIWENRSIWVAPLLVTGVLCLGFAISTIGLPERRRAALQLDAAKQRAAIELPYDIAVAMLIFTALIVGIFYCLDALHGERRDRSILFWKSLPVSDTTAVLAKASIPLVVLPLLTFALVLLTHAFMLLLTTAVLLGSGAGSAAWMQWGIVPSPLAVAYVLIVVALWQAPIYAWFLLVSGWAKRAVFIWAVLPLIVVNVFERIAFHTADFCSLLQYRFFGFITQGLTPIARNGGVPAGRTLASLTPGRFLATPGLWIGLVLAAVFLAAAVRLRRSRSPI